MFNGCLIRLTAILIILLSGCYSPLSSAEELSNSPTQTPAILQADEEIEMLVYFTSTARYAQGIQPFEEPVVRRVPANSYLPLAVLEEFFRGPTQSERELELETITSGFSGLRSIEIEHGYAHVFLEGACQSLGATYTIAQPIFRNLAQFPEIHYVKIYDENGTTGDPQGPGNSIPLCLEP